MNLQLVEQIVTLMGEYPVSEITLEQEGQRICVRKPLVSAPLTLPAEVLPSEMAEVPALEMASLSAELAPELVPEEARLLTAAMVGIFYHAEPPLPYAATVLPGAVVGYIESMKLMNDVVAEEGGRVTDVLVEDGAPVEYGQGLFRLAV